MGEKLVIHTLFTATGDPDIHVIIRLRDRLGEWVTSISDYFLDLSPPAVEPGTALLFSAEIEFRLEAGTYDVSVGLGKFRQNNTVTSYTDGRAELGPIQVHFDYANKAPFVGKFGPKVQGRYAVAGTAVRGI